MRARRRSSGWRDGNGKESPLRGGGRAVVVRALRQTATTFPTTPYLGSVARQFTEMPTNRQSKLLDVKALAVVIRSKVVRMELGLFARCTGESRRHLFRNH
jgi:hypothetical protein